MPILLTSMYKDKEILDALNTYNTEMETKGYHFGDKINLPKELPKTQKASALGLGDKETRFSSRSSIFTLEIMVKPSILPEMEKY